MYGLTVGGSPYGEDSCSQSQSRIASRCTITRRSALGRCQTSSTSMFLSSSPQDNYVPEVWEANNSCEYDDRQKGLVLQRNSKKQIYGRLNSCVANFVAALDFAVDHTELPFTWPTQYNEADQEHIVFDEDKVKVVVDVEHYKIEDWGKQQLQDIVQGWIGHLQTTLKELRDRKPTDFTPMAEYELWRIRENKYNTLLEQLKYPLVIETIGNIFGRMISLFFVLIVF